MFFLFSLATPEQVRLM